MAHVIDRETVLARLREAEHLEAQLALLDVRDPQRQALLLRWAIAADTLSRSLFVCEEALSDEALMALQGEYDPDGEGLWRKYRTTTRRLQRLVDDGAFTSWSSE